MTLISGVIITFNEESNIERCIRSLLPVVDEIVVLDSFSTDKTKEICSRYNVRFFEHAFDTYGDQKNRALAHATYDYILSLDADEALHDSLRDSILEIKHGFLESAYRMNRIDNYYGNWMYDLRLAERKLRVFDRTKGSWVNCLAHESWRLKNNRAKVGWSHSAI
jgi:glycosyltransferase involved in cell wall biosynthesis